LRIGDGGGELPGTRTVRPDRNTTSKLGAGAAALGVAVVSSTNLSGSTRDLRARPPSHQASFHFQNAPSTIRRSRPNGYGKSPMH
jgi:hypothetical protein